MCTALYCRPNGLTSTCVFSPQVGNTSPPIGAAIGTTCDSGKICDQGLCTLNVKVAPIGDCVLGDDVVTSENSGLNSDLTDLFPNVQNTCEEIFLFISSQNFYPIAYCTVNTIFSQTCCKSCASK